MRYRWKAEIEQATDKVKFGATPSRIRDEKRSRRESYGVKGKDRRLLKCGTYAIV